MCMAHVDDFDGAGGDGPVPSILYRGVTTYCVPVLDGPMRADHAILTLIPARWPLCEVCGLIPPPVCVCVCVCVCVAGQAALHYVAEYGATLCVRALHECGTAQNTDLTPI